MIASRIPECEIGKLELNPGDILVVRMPGHIPRQHWNKISEQVRGSVPDSVKILLISDGIRLSTMTIDGLKRFRGMLDKQIRDLDSR